MDRENALKKAEKLLQQGRLHAAIAEYAAIVPNHPRDWTSANTLGDLYLRAGQPDNAVAQYVRVGDLFLQDGFLQKAAAVFKKVLKITPGHQHALAQAGRIAEAQGLAADAKNYYAALASLRGASGDVRDEGEAVGVSEPRGAEATPPPTGNTKAEADRDPLHPAAAVAEGGPRSTTPALVSEVLRPFTLEVPLAVDESVNGDDASSEAMTAAVTSADPIALRTRDVDESLEQVFELNSRDFTANSLSVGEDGGDRSLMEDADLEIDLTEALEALLEARPVIAHTSGRTITATDHPPTAAGDSATVRGPVVAGKNAELDQPLDHVFEQFREDIARQQSDEEALRHYQVALTGRQVGLPDDDTIKALEIAARSPRVRFEAGRLLGEIWLARGAIPQAIEWFERAAESSPPGRDAARALLYQLAQALESVHEPARALAVYLELQGDAGDYRDVAERIQRLL